MWQAEAVIVSSLSALPATAVGQILLTLAKFCYSTVFRTCFTPSIQLVLVIYYLRTQVNQQRLMISNIMNNDSYVTSFPSSDDPNTKPTIY